MPRSSPVSSERAVSPALSTSSQTNSSLPTDLSDISSLSEEDDYEFVPQFSASEDEDEVSSSVVHPLVDLGDTHLHESSFVTDGFPPETIRRENPSTTPSSLESIELHIPPSSSVATLLINSPPNESGQLRYPDPLQESFPPIAHDDVARQGQDYVVLQSALPDVSLQNGREVCMEEVEEHKGHSASDIPTVPFESLRIPWEYFKLSLSNHYMHWAYAFLAVAVATGTLNILFSSTYTYITGAEEPAPVATLGSYFSSPTSSMAHQASISHHVHHAPLPSNSTLRRYGSGASTQVPRPISWTSESHESKELALRGTSELSSYLGNVAQQSRVWLSSASGDTLRTFALSSSIAGGKVYHSPSYTIAQHKLIRTAKDVSNSFHIRRSLFLQGLDGVLTHVTDHLAQEWQMLWSLTTSVMRHWHVILSQLQMEFQWIFGMLQTCTDYATSQMHRFLADQIHPLGERIRHKSTSFTQTSYKIYENWTLSMEKRIGELACDGRFLKPRATRSYQRISLRRKYRSLLAEIARQTNGQTPYPYRQYITSRFKKIMYRAMVQSGEAKLQLEDVLDKVACATRALSHSTSLDV